MKKIIIFGTGDFADILAAKLEENSDNIIVGYTLNKKYIVSAYYKDRKLLPFEELNEIIKPNECSLYLGVIGKGMFEERERLFYEIVQKGYNIANYISPCAHVKTPNIGTGNIIMENVVIEKHCQIGNGNIIWPNVVMPHHNQIGNFNNISPSVSFSGFSKIGSRCFIGNNASLNNSVTVNDCALVGGGVFVSENLDKYKVLVSPRSYILEGKTSTDFK